MSSLIQKFCTSVDLSIAAMPIPSFAAASIPLPGALQLDSCRLGDEVTLVPRL